MRRPISGFYPYVYPKTLALHVWNKIRAGLEAHEKRLLAVELKHRSQ